MCNDNMLYHWKKTAVTVFSNSVFLSQKRNMHVWRVAARSRALDSSSGVSDQQSVGSSKGLDTCVLKQDI